MKKSLSLLCALLMLVCALMCSCKGADTGKDKDTDESTPQKTESDGMIFDFSEIDLSQYIKLPEDLKTHDFSSSAIKKLPTDKDVQKEIDKVLKELAEPEYLDKNAVVRDGDTVVIDYVGTYKNDGKNADGTEYKAGDKFYGGEASDTEHTVDLENSVYIDGFDRGLIGMKVNEEKKLELKFPSPYFNSDLAGVEVIFKVKVDKIERTTVPQLTDSLVKEHPDMFEDMESAQAYREYVKKKLEANTAEENTELLREIVMSYLNEKSTVLSYPEQAYTAYYNSIQKKHIDTMIASKKSRDQYAAENGYEHFDSLVEEETKSTLKKIMILYAMSDALGVTVTDEDVKAYAQNDYDTNIAPNLQIYSAYFGISNFNDYYKIVKEDASVKETLLLDKAVEALLGLNK